jgi:hypothetical protein
MVLAGESSAEPEGRNAGTAGRPARRRDRGRRREGLTTALGRDPVHLHGDQRRSSWCGYPPSAAGVEGDVIADFVIGRSDTGIGHLIRGSGSQYLTT